MVTASGNGYCRKVGLIPSFRFSLTYYQEKMTLIDEGVVTPYSPSKAQQPRKSGTTSKQGTCAVSLVKLRSSSIGVITERDFRERGDQNT